MELDTDVLVVGAGPVGLTAAFSLHDKGVRVRIIDVNAKPILMTKASGTQGRTLEQLPAAVVASMQRESLTVKTMRAWENVPGAPPKVLMTMDMRGKSDTYEGVVAQEQWRTEKCLTDFLESKKLKVERSTRLVSFTQDDARVACELETPSGTTHLTCSWLLAADGGRSSIRKALSLAFDGETMEENFFALHASFKGLGRLGIDATSEVILSAGGGAAGGMFFSMPMPNDAPCSHLIIVDLDNAQSAPFTTGAVDDRGRPLLRDPTPDEVLELMAARVGGASAPIKIVPGSVKWCTGFKINSRQVEHYRSGRVFLAGDACHCHSPLGAQGMNMGMQDALNLTWKLAMVVKGQASAFGPLLETYDEERRNTDERICHAIEKAAHGASSRSPLVFLIRGRLQRLIGLLPVLHGPAARAVAMQIHSYASFGLAHEHWERPPAFPPWPVSRVFPAGGARRRQNLYRWLGSRVRAGDRLPNFELPASDDGTPGQPVYPYYEQGWLLLLCEGFAHENDDLAHNVPGVDILSVDAMRELGERTRTRSGGVITTVAVLPAGHPALETLGVQAQCLFLVRPDAHVALRSEPVRAAVVLRYLQERIGAVGVTVKRGECPRSSPSFDPLPVVVWSLMAVAAAAVYAMRGLR